MLGLLIAAFESMTGRAKGPVEKSKGEMKEVIKGDVTTQVLDEQKDPVLER